MDVCTGCKDGQMDGRVWMNESKDGCTHFYYSLCNYYTFISWLSNWKTNSENNKLLQENKL